eukprot:2564470-Rhodomonas_salina.4
MRPGISSTRLAPRPLPDLALRPGRLGFRKALQSSCAQPRRTLRTAPRCPSTSASDTRHLIRQRRWTCRSRSGRAMEGESGEMGTGGGEKERGVGGMEGEWMRALAGSRLRQRETEEDGSRGWGREGKRGRKEREEREREEHLKRAKLTCTAPAGTTEPRAVSTGQGVPNRVGEKGRDARVANADRAAVDRASGQVEAIGSVEGYVRQGRGQQKDSKMIGLVER